MYRLHLFSKVYMQRRMIAKTSCQQKQLLYFWKLQPKKYKTKNRICLDRRSICIVSISSSHSWKNAPLTKKTKPQPRSNTIFEVCFLFQSCFSLLINLIVFWWKTGDISLASFLLSLSSILSAYDKLRFLIRTVDMFFFIFVVKKCQNVNFSREAGESKSLHIPTLLFTKCKLDSMALWHFGPKGVLLSQAYLPKLEVQQVWRL